jgi:hypothetical protein
MKLSKTLFLLIVLFCFIPFIASAAAKYKTYSDKGYSFKYPADWKAQISDDKSITIETPDGEASFYIGTTAAGAGVTSKLIVDTYLDGQGFKNTLSAEDSVPSKDELQDMGLTDGYVATFASTAEGKPMGMFVFVGIKGDIAYIIVYGTSNDAKKEYLDEITECLKSFVVK